MTMVTAWDSPVLTPPCCPSGSRWPSGSCRRPPLACSWHGLEHVLSWIIYYKCKRLSSTYWTPGTILSALHAWSQSMLSTAPGGGHIFNTISHFWMSRQRHRAVEYFIQRQEEAERGSNLGNMAVEFTVWTPSCLLERQMQSSLPRRTDVASPNSHRV